MADMLLEKGAGPSMFVEARLPPSITSRSTHSFIRSLHSLTHSKHAHTQSLSLNDPALQDVHRRTPLDMAKTMGHTRLVQHLKKAARQYLKGKKKDEL